MGAGEITVGGDRGGEIVGRAVSRVGGECGRCVGEGGVGDGAAGFDVVCAGHCDRDDSGGGGDFQDAGGEGRKGLLGGESAVGGLDDVFSVGWCA